MTQQIPSQDLVAWFQTYESLPTSQRFSVIRISLVLCPLTAVCPVGEIINQRSVNRSFVSRIQIVLEPEK